MSQSRRGFLAATGTGAAVVAATTVLPTSAGASRVAGASGPLTVFVTDVKAGEVTLMHGDREVVVHDHDLVARLTQAARPLYR